HGRPGPGRTAGPRGLARRGLAGGCRVKTRSAACPECRNPGCRRAAVRGPDGNLGPSTGSCFRGDRRGGRPDARRWELDMPDEQRHESADLGDYEVLDAGDTLDGAPGDDPLDRGVVPPQHWSAALRYESTAAD